MNSDKVPAPMTTIKSMTPRRWAKFAQHVAAGGEARNLLDGQEQWRGVLLENYPYDAEEYIEEECESQRYYKMNLRQLHQKPRLRFQEYADRLPDRQAILALWPTLQFSVQGQWLSMVEILLLK
jgi:hypothetical protein